MQNYLLYYYDDNSFIFNVMKIVLVLRCVCFLKFLCFNYCLESYPHIDDVQCSSWSWKRSNPIIYWINENHSLYRRKQFYAYMSYVNFLHHRVKWKIKFSSLNRMILGSENLVNYTHLLSAFSSHVFALTSASNHFEMYVVFIYSIKHFIIVSLYLSG